MDDASAGQARSGIFFVPSRPSFAYQFDDVRRVMVSVSSPHLWAFREGQEARAARIEVCPHELPAVRLAWFTGWANPAAAGEVVSSATLLSRRGRVIGTAFWRVALLPVLLAAFHDDGKADAKRSHSSSSVSVLLRPGGI